MAFEHQKDFVMTMKLSGKKLDFDRLVNKWRFRVFSDFYGFGVIFNKVTSLLTSSIELRVLSSGSHELLLAFKTFKELIKTAHFQDCHQTFDQPPNCNPTSSRRHSIAIHSMLKRNYVKHSYQALAALLGSIAGNHLKDAHNVHQSRI